MRLFAGCTLMLALVWAAGSALADPLPQLHDVTGVAADDVLNIRAEPTARAPAIGGLGPGARGIEVTARDSRGTWGRVNHGETAGWVFLRYLRARGVWIDNYNLPVGLRCFGTEPFWNLTHRDGTLAFEQLGGALRSWEVISAQDTGFPDDLRRMIRAAGTDGVLTAFVYPDDCSDGMSDRRYGLSVALMSDDASPLLTGCCSLAPLSAGP